MKKLLLFYLFISSIIAPLTFFGNDTDKKKDWYLETIIRHGRVIPVHDDIWDVGLISPEIRFGKQTTGQKLCEHYFNFPHYGIAFRYGYFNSPFLDKKFALYGYFNAPIFHYQQFSFHYQLGFGIAYWSNPHDSISNPENRYIGSHLNAYIDFELTVEYELTKSIDLIASTDFSHSSNGTTKVPNLGINVLSGHLGIRYHLNQRQPQVAKTDIFINFIKNNTLYLFAAPAFRQSRKSDATYFAGTLQIGYLRQPHPIFRFGGGIDIMYNGELQNHSPKKKSFQTDYLCQAVFASCELIYDRLILHVALATYINRAFNFYESYYERAGLKFLIGEHRNHFAGISIKAHGGIADYIEWTYGYEFLKWERKNN